MEDMQNGGGMGGFPGGMNFNMGGMPGGGAGGMPAGFDPNEIFKMFFSQNMGDEGGFGSFMNQGGRAQGFPGGMGGFGGMPGFANMGGGGRGGRGAAGASGPSFQFRM